MLINEMSIFFISLIFNTFFFLLYWGIKILFFFKITGQSWHHSWEKWYYLWGSFQKSWKFQIQIFYYNLFQKSTLVLIIFFFYKLIFELLHFKDQPLCWSCFLKKKNWFRIIPYSKINPCVDHIDFKLLHFKDQPLCWSYFLKISNSNHYISKNNTCVDHIF